VTTLAVLEQRDGVLRKISHEVVTAAQRLGGSVEAVVCAAAAVQGADQAAKFGADKIVTLTNPAFAKYAPEACAQALAERAKQGGYRTIVFAASATGKDLAPRVAAKLGVGVAADLTDLATDGDALVVTRPVYAGKALLTVKVKSQPAVVSLRPNVFTPVERPKAGAAETVAVNVPAVALRCARLRPRLWGRSTLRKRRSSSRAAAVSRSLPTSKCWKSSRARLVVEPRSVLRVRLSMRAGARTPIKSGKPGRR
jgi:electron transfer flavoprotein alpha subunit